MAKYNPLNVDLLINGARVTGFDKGDNSITIDEIDKRKRDMNDNITFLGTWSEGAKCDYLDYSELLERSYAITKANSKSNLERLKFLNNAVFKFVTHESKTSSMMTKKALEICLALSEGTLRKYKETEQGEFWHSIMVNMSFFENKIQWRDCFALVSFWNLHYFPAGQPPLTIESCDLYNAEGEQLLELTFGKKEWDLFIDAMVRFAAEEPHTT